MSSNNTFDDKYDAKAENDFSYYVLYEPAWKERQKSEKFDIKWGTDLKGYSISKRDILYYLEIFKDKIILEEEVITIVDQLLDTQEESNERIAIELVKSLKFKE